MNPYYTRVTDFTPFDRARSGEVDAEFNAVLAGFDLLPSDPNAVTRGVTTFGTESGSGNNYVVASPNNHDAYIDGEAIQFVATHANSTATTLNVDGIGQVNLVRYNGAALTGGEIVTGIIYEARFDLDNNRWQLTAPDAGIVADTAASAATATAAATAASGSQSAAASSEAAAAGSASAASTSAIEAATSAAVAAVSEEWAVNPIDDDVTGFSGQFSALHWASGSAQWASRAEDDAVPSSFGGDGSTTFSAFHWAQKAAASASANNPTGTSTDDPTSPGTFNASLQWQNANSVPLAAIGYTAGDDFQIRNDVYNGNVNIDGRDGAGQLANLLRANPSGELQLFYDSVQKFATRSHGINVFGSLNGDPLTGDNQNTYVNLEASGGSDIGQIGFLGTSVMYMRSRSHGSIVAIDGEDNSGSLRSMFQGDPDADSRMYYAGEQRIATQLTGAAIRGSQSNNPESAGSQDSLLRLRNSGGTTNATFGFPVSGTLLTMDNFVHGANVEIRGQDLAGVTRTLFGADPDGTAALHHAGALALYTRADGINIGADSTNAVVSFRDGLTDKAEIDWNISQGFLNIRNRENSGRVNINGQSGLGVVRPMVETHPDFWVKLYYAGSESARTRDRTLQNGAAFEVHDGAALFPVRAVRSVFKSSSTARSTTVLSADPDLSLSLTTGHYTFEAWVHTASTTPQTDIRLSMHYNQAVPYQYGYTALGLSGGVSTIRQGQLTSTNDALDFDSVISLADSNLIKIEGSFEVAVSGTISLQWAQGPSAAAEVRVLQQSRLHVYRMEN